MIITLFHGIAGWTAAALVAFGFGTMTAHLEVDLTEWLETPHV